MTSCFSRSSRFSFFASEEDASENNWLSQQLKLTRDQLDRKSGLCDQLAQQLRSTQAELESRTGVVREVRSLLGATNSELRAAALAASLEKDEHAEVVAALQRRVDELRSGEVVCPAREAAAATDAVELHGQLAAGEAPVASSAPGSFAHLETGSAAGSHCDQLEPRSPVSIRSVGQESQSELQRLRTELAKLQQQQALLQQDLRRERELHEEAVRLLQSSRLASNEKVTELNQELTNLSNGLEQREDDILNIQFGMVELQNRLSDQARLVVENANAFQVASEELADKEEELDLAKKRQDELLGEMEKVTSQMDSQVKKLSQELEGSRAAYKALDEQTRAVVSRLESERDGLAAELEKNRSRAAEVPHLELPSPEAAAGPLRRHSVSLDDAWLAADVREAALATPPPALESPAMKAMLHDLREQLRASKEEVAAQQAQIVDLTDALERARLLEREALERFDRNSAGGGSGTASAFADLAALQTPRGRPESAQRTPDGKALPQGDGEAAAASAGLASNVLIAVDIDLGSKRGVERLAVAPWQTKSDFDSVAREFLEANGIRSTFAPALVAYLEAVEREAESFPALVHVDLADIYGKYG
eukprot:TRINITY_DN22963_c0_g1_i1.p1 TRINITY_DN22963_c0_g1~~TRINITY_DN22963_c0_g1_i1.p1  ORF type:complete len:611 (+),score=192.70 TRINITY_DN22963_c0_g1_i1:44-1834(+)